MIAISSTTIIAKAFHEQCRDQALRQLVVSVLIVEDLIAIVLMSVSPRWVESETLSLLTLGKSSGAFVGVSRRLSVSGAAAHPAASPRDRGAESAETTAGRQRGDLLCARVAREQVGYSVALGAFLAGSLIAESGQSRRIEPLVEPVRDVFAAVFFVSVGMSIDPHVLAERCKRSWY